ncbi:site-specific integrase [uncultured Alistipes sp.]|uniref:site-specific integrase n=1 Tax=uncultured Alistipes sp. TaxID=538949 RepID=UPI0025AA1FDC|nr:site-specific integrase [uncultured Alistipes sp.]
MEIKIRQKPQRSTGKTSLVLEYYYGYTRDDEGRIKHRRKFETLEYYLYTDPKNKLERDHNKVNLEMAEKVKAKRLLAEQNEQYGFAVKYKIRTNLVEYIKGLIEQRKESPGNWGNWDSALKHLVAYAGTNTTFEMVDKKFVEGFKTYLAKQAKTKSGTALSTNSQSSYFLKLKAALNQAVEDGIIPHSPAMSVKPAHVEDVHREYLTFDELQRLAKTECPYPVLKDAFLFSCLTGMRWSDINKLTWAEVQEFDGGTRIVFRQKKTKGLEYLDITGQAVRYMGQRGKADEWVFAGLKYSAWHNLALREWCLKAGITKHITFHCGRHTFAVLQLSLGTEIYTVSKLLGHRELKTTQVYAQIMDAKKREAVNRIPEL